jgi:hypothetical protein
MMAAMGLGMAAFGLLLALALRPFGTSMGDAPVAVMALVMAVEMTVPMVGWMHFRHRMAPARSAEMAASMLVPSLLAVALHRAGALGETGVMVVQHAVMVPAMLGVMLWQREAYGGPPRTALGATAAT